MQQATPEELDGPAHWESQEALIFQLQSALLVTSILAAGWKVKNQICGPDLYLIDYWGGKHSDPSLQANAPPQLPTKNWFK